MGAGIGFIPTVTGGGGPATLPGGFITSAPGVVTNDSGAPTSALAGTTSTLPAGNYMVTLSYHWNKGQNAHSDFVGNLVLDGASVTAWGGEMHKQQPVEVGGGDVAGTLTDQSIPQTAMYHATFPTEVAHSFDFQFHGELAGERVAVHTVALAFHQIS